MNDHFLIHRVIPSTCLAEEAGEDAAPAAANAETPLMALEAAANKAITPEVDAELVGQ